MTCKPLIRKLEVHNNPLAKELLRKKIHISAALIPNLARWNITITATLLCIMILLYVHNETARMCGLPTGLINRITLIASRRNEKGFIWGPVTLGVGVLTALLYFPHPLATISIYALAFGDSLACIVGKIWGRKSIPWPGNKTFIGSCACFLAVFISVWIFLSDIKIALLSAAVATGLELITLKDVDNVLIPACTGTVLFFVLYML